MACSSERSQQIGAMAGGRLDADATGELLGHLEGCASCSAEFDLAADLARVGSVDAAAVVRPAGRLLPFRRVAVALAAAAALLLIVVMLGGDDEPSSRLRALAQLTPPPAVDQVLRGSDPETRAEREQALSLYRAKDYRGASVLLGKVVTAEPDDRLASFYLGVSLLQLKDFEPALAALDKVATQGQDLLQERALWYLANAHLALGDESAARATLEKLEMLDGDYLLNARELLNQLDER